MSDFVGGRRNDECHGDLLARERRGELSGADCIALRAHLSECSSCHLARQIQVDFDDVSGVDLLDGARIERLSSAARRWTAHRRNRSPSRLMKGRKRLRSLGLATAALLISGTASATVWLWRHPQSFELLAFLRHAEPAVAPPAPSPRVPASKESAPLAEPVADSEPKLVSRPATGHVSRSSTRSAARRVAHLADNQSSPDSAGQLLRQASDARRSGDPDRATFLYRRLQHDYPSSSEAVLSSVAIGGLLLDQKAPAAALAEFNTYLESSRGGGLLPEALYGRGRALGALGDRLAERQTWERLLAEFPDSAYSPLARRRLADLK